MNGYKGAEGRQLVVGIVAVAALGYVAYRHLTHQPLWDSGPKLTGTGVPVAVAEIAIALLTTIGGVVLALGRSALEVVQSALGMGGDASSRIAMPEPHPQPQTRPLFGPEPLGPGGQLVARGKALGLPPMEPIFRLDKDNYLRRDLELERVHTGPQTVDEITLEILAASQAGDWDRVSEMYDRLHPDQAEASEE